MQDKPLYEFPPRLSRSQRQAQAAHDLQERKKMQSNMYKNLLLGAVIFAISFIVRAAAIKILLILIAAGNIIVALLLYKYYSFSSEGIYTKIYADRLEHMQKAGLSGKSLEVTLYFDEVIASRQDNHGRMVMTLENPKKSVFEIVDRSGEKSPYTLKSSTIELFFADTKSKLTLINDFSDMIKYPKKEYNVIEDDDDYYTKEDMLWDKLHKHGL